MSVADLDPTDTHAVRLVTGCAMSPADYLALAAMQRSAAKELRRTASQRATSSLKRAQRERAERLDRAAVTYRRLAAEATR